MRTGDTPAGERQALVRRPPDLLITTPESLYLMLTSNAADTLANVETVIVDEIHALAATKRGAHLAVSLERLEEVTAPAAAAHRAVGHAAPARRGRPLPRRLVRSRRARATSPSSTPGSPRRWRSTSSSRSRTCPTSAARRPPSRRAVQRPGDGRPGAAAHEHLAVDLPAHPRADPRPPLDDRVLQRPSSGRAPGGQAQRALRRADRRPCRRRPDAPRRRARQGPPRFARPRAARHRRGRAQARRPAGHRGHQQPRARHRHGRRRPRHPGRVARARWRAASSASAAPATRSASRAEGTIYPKHRGDLLEAAVVARRMIDGEIEHTRYLRNPLDVLAQQIVAHVAARGEVAVADVAAMVRRTATFAELSDELLRNTLEMLAGRYPSEEFSELRPRLVWDRVNDTVRARDGSKRLAVTSGGTIPDRGLFGVFLPDGKRVGELDEEMVYESRPGETFLLGASTWRIEDITFERVTVTPAPGRARQDAVLARRPPGPPARAGTGPRPLRARAARGRAGAARGGCATTTPSTSSRRATCCSTSPSRPRPPASCPTTARSWSSGSATRSATGGSACSARSARRSTRRGRWRSSAVSPTATTCRSSRCGATTASSCGCPRRPTTCRSTRSRSTPTTSRSSWCRRCRRRRCSRRGSGSAPDARCCCRAAGPTSARRCGSNASAPPTCSPSPPSTRRSRCCWRRRASACRTCSTCRRCARCSASCVPGRCASSRRDVEAVADGAEPAVQLDRRLHVRGRRPAGRAAGGRARARPRPARRPARRRGAARAARSGRPRRRRARPPAPVRRSACPHGRRAARRAAARRRPHGHRDRAAVRGERRRSRRRASSGGARRRAPGDRDLGSPGSSASPPPTTPPATATPSAARCRSGLPQVFTDPVPRPLEELVARYARTHGPFVERDVAARFGLPESRVAGALAALEADGTDRARRVPSRRRAARVVRRRRAPPAAPPVARRRCGARSSRSRQAALAEFLPAWQGVGNDAAGGSRRSSRRSACSPARRSWRRRSSATCSPPGSPATGRRCSTSCARPARSCGSAPARSVPTTAASGCASSTRCRCSRPAGNAVDGPTGALHDTGARRARRRWSELLVAAAGRRPSGPPTTSCSPRCGISCGPARSPTTRWRRCGR